MNTSDPIPDEQMLEECLDELDALLPRLTRFPPALVALALRLHLEALLQMLLETHLATRQDVRDFVRALEQQTLADL